MAPRSSVPESFIKFCSAVLEEQRIKDGSPNMLYWQSPCFPLGNPKIMQIKIYKIGGAVWHYVVNIS